jgi:hypothetical protein
MKKLLQIWRRCADAAQGVIPGVGHRRLITISQPLHRFSGFVHDINRAATYRVFESKGGVRCGDTRIFVGVMAPLCKHCGFD